MQIFALISPADLCKLLRSARCYTNRARRRCSESPCTRLYTPVPALRRCTRSWF